MVWHLLLKDIRRFRWWLLAWAALLGALWAVTIILKWSFFQLAPSTLPLVVPFQTGLLNWIGKLFLILFIVKLVQEDPLTGSTAFWLTRPIKRWNLWLAKSCFIFVLLLPLYALELWGVTPGLFSWLFKMIELVGVMYLVWIVALYTSRLSTAAWVLFGVYIIYSTARVLLEMIPAALGIGPYKSGLHFADIYAMNVNSLAVSKLLIEDMAIIIFSAVIIIYNYLTHRVTRAAIMSVIACILVLVLGTQWHVVIVPSFTSRVAAESEALWTQRSELQDKVDSAKPGDTITIKAGEYSGGLIISKPLTLVGEAADKVVICQGGGEYGIKVMSDDVAIENLSVRRCRFGILVRSHKDEWKNLAKTRNVRISNVKVNDCLFGIYSLKTENLAVENCAVEDIKCDGIWVSWEPENTIISGNRLKNIGDQGIWLGPHPNNPDTCAKNGIISGNIVDTTRESGIFFAGENCRITSNLICNVKGGGYAVGAISLMGALVNNVEISRNIIRNNSSAGIGIKTDKKEHCSGIVIKENNIYVNGKLGLENSTEAPVDARNNWWGAAEGPNDADKNPQGTGNGISGNILYAPWERTQINLPAHCGPK